MAEVAGLRIRLAHNLADPTPAAKAALILMREAAEGKSRRIHRHIERLCSEAMVLQDYEYLERLYIHDEMWSTTGPSIASAL